MSELEPTTPTADQELGRPGVWKRSREWLRDIFAEEYELTIWFHKETHISETGVKIISHTEPKTFRLTGLSTLNQNKVVGRDVYDNPFRIVTSQPFDYNLTKIR